MQKLARAVLRRRIELRAEPLRDAQPVGEGRFVTAGDAAFELRGSRVPWGWLEVDFEVSARGPLAPRLVFELPLGHRPFDIVALTPPSGGHIRSLVRVPRGALSMRFEPVAPPGELRLGRLVVREIGATEAGARLAAPIATDLAKDPARIARAARKSWSLFRRGGAVALRHGLIDKAHAPAGDRYPEWLHHYAELRRADVDQIRARIASMLARPSFSLVTGPAPAEATLASIRAQLYPDWTMCATPEEARGAFVVRLGPGDVLTPEALYLIADELLRHPEADVVYTDEDRLGAGTPHFKPDWNPELLYSWNYLGRLTAVRASLLEGPPPRSEHELSLRATARARLVRHIPRIGVHRQDEPMQEPDAAAVSAVFPGALVTPGIAPHTLHVRPPTPSPAPLASLIIPTRDGADLVEQCVRSIEEHTLYRPFEIVLVDNQSRDPRALALFARLEQEGRARVLRHDAPFNYSAINNRAVREARGDLVVLVNNDIEVVSPDWLGELVSHAVRPGVGAVGARLLYPDGRIQHGGVLLGLGGIAGHLFRRIEKDEVAYFGRPQVTQAVGAVTAACLAIRKETFLSVGGLNETDLTVAFNDVDLCLKLLAAGYRNVYTPHATLMHHESVSRGTDDTPAKKARFDAEYSYVLRTWGEALSHDPAHNPNLSLDTFDIALAFPPRAKPPWK